MGHAFLVNEHDCTEPQFWSLYVVLEIELRMFMLLNGGDIFLGLKHPQKTSHLGNPCADYPSAGLTL